MGGRALKTGGLLDKVNKAEGDSLSARIENISDAWSSTQRQPSSSYSSWPMEVYDDAIIVRAGDEYQRIPYSVGADGEVSFDTANATTVNREWVEKSVEELVAVQIQKTDDPRQIVFGWANIPAEGGKIVVDKHEQWISPGDLEDAIYVFNLAFREADEEHAEEVVGQLVESVWVDATKLDAWATGDDGEVDPAKVTALKTVFPTAGWWAGFYIPDAEVYAKCRQGPNGEAPEYEMFSIGGLGLLKQEDPPDAA